MNENDRHLGAAEKGVKQKRNSLNIDRAKVELWGSFQNPREHRPGNSSVLIVSTAFPERSFNDCVSV